MTEVERAIAELIAMCTEVGETVVECRGEPSDDDLAVIEQLEDGIRARMRARLEAALVRRDRAVVRTVVGR